MNKPLQIVAVALVALLLVGCNSAPKRDPLYAPAMPVAAPPAPQGNGAIYQAGYENSWFEDQRARRVGDMLTVKLVEQTDAKKDAKSTVSRSNEISMTNPTILGSTPQFNLPAAIPLDSTKDNNLNNSLSSSTEFSGEGDAKQSNELTGDVTVTVVEVLPNGYLRVRGEKRIGITQGNEYIKLSGIVRPADIDSTNTVQSNRIADATMVYVGDGQTHGATYIGWLAKFFVSSFLPF